MLHAASILDLRYSVPWHRIEREPGQYDFGWLDGPMRFMQDRNMRPVLDPLHHVSFPDWLTDGFASAHFPERYEEFVAAVARRYPWVDRYTVFNEPLPTTLFCSYTGWWYPFHASDEHFVRMAINVARAMCRACERLRGDNPEVRFYHMDTCEVHRAVDKASEKWAEFANVRRFLMHDLVLGSVGRSHPAHGYLERHGCSDEDLGWLADHRARIDVLGLDYYIQSEMEWHWDRALGRPNVSSPVANPCGFTRIATEYADRFGTPIMLGETNLRGTPRDRLTWLKFMEAQCEKAAASTDFRGFCWYPSIDSTDWCHLCKQATGTIDPQGVWSLGPGRWERIRTELADAYTLLAQGRTRAADLPAWEFSAGVADAVVGYRKLMDWPVWLPQEEPVDAA
jgi:hypothetical protein